MSKKWLRRRERLFEIIEVGNDFDMASRVYDFINAFTIVLNLATTILYTYEEIREKYGVCLLGIERITVAFFCVDFIMRVFTARFLYPGTSESRAICKYLFSVTGIIDWLSFLPYYLPFFFPAGTVAFRMIRIVRIYRLFEINSRHDSLSVITTVLKNKRQQLISSVFIILVLMIASSLCMYSLECEVQPEVFTNAFSGVWWAASTLLTVGYGDIYPITTLGKVFGIFISFLGVGMVAIPTGIISAGFVDQYSNIKKRMEYGYESDLQFIKVQMDADDDWVNKRIADLGLPTGIIVSVIKRDGKLIVPRGDVVIMEKDELVLGSEPFDEKDSINLKEIVLKKQNPWTGMKIKDLDISRRAIIVLVKRKNKALIPRGNMTLLEGDHVFLHTELHIANANEINI